MILSIQIPTTYDRREQDEALQLEILRQAQLLYPEDAQIGFIHAEDDIYGWRTGNLELMVFRDDKSLTIGEKRERMYATTEALYSWQVDSDDWIDERAIEKIVEALKSGPDCVTFQEKCIINGIDKQSNHSIHYPGWQDKFDGWDYVRTPYMKDVIRTSIAKSVPVPHIRFGEDHLWSTLIRPLLKTEVHIPEFIYHYVHRSTDHNQRYGIKNS